MTADSDRTEIAAADLAARLRDGTAPTIVDVRSAIEFRRGHIPGAIHIPFWRIAAHLDRISAKPDDEVVVYCGHGPRAAWAEAALRRHGFRRVLDLVGHWAGWRKSVKAMKNIKKS